MLSSLQNRWRHARQCIIFCHALCLYECVFNLHYRPDRLDAHGLGVVMVVNEQNGNQLYNNACHRSVIERASSPLGCPSFFFLCDGQPSVYMLATQFRMKDDGIAASETRKGQQRRKPTNQLCLAQNCSVQITSHEIRAENHGQRIIQNAEIYIIIQSSVCLDYVYVDMNWIYKTIWQQQRSAGLTTATVDNAECRVFLVYI